MERICTKCDTVISQYNPGNLCFSCQEKQLEQKVTASEDLIDAEGYAAILGLDSAETLKRKAREGGLAPRVPRNKKWLWRKDDIETWFKQKQQAGNQEWNRDFRMAARGIASNLRTCCNARMGQTLSDKIGDKVYGLKAGEYFFGLTAAGQVEPIELLNVDRPIAVKMLKQLPKEDFPELIGITDWGDMTYDRINEDLIVRQEAYF